MEPFLSLLDMPMKRRAYDFFSICALAAGASCAANLAWRVSQPSGARIGDFGLYRLIRIILLKAEVDHWHQIPPFFVRHYDLYNGEQLLAFFRGGLLANLALATVLCAPAAVLYRLLPGQQRGGWRIWLCKSQWVLLPMAVGLCLLPVFVVPFRENALPGAPRLWISAPIWIAATGALTHLAAGGGRRVERLGWLSRRLVAGLLAAAILAPPAWDLAYERAAASALPPSGSRPNVLLISIDTLRAGHLHCYGYRRNTTPSIDRIAEEGFVFENAEAPTSWTVPSHMTILTGRNILSHNVRYFHHRLAPGIVTLPEVLSGRGYNTLGVVSGPTLLADYGYFQGFDEYDDYSVMPGREEVKDKVTGRETADTAVKLLAQWRRTSQSRPFFLFVHMWDVHEHYNPPPPFDTMYDPDYSGTINSRSFQEAVLAGEAISERDLQHVIALYDGEIRYTDWRLGRLFDALREMGVFEDTLTMITSDHGEEFLEHGSYGHCKTLHRETVHVPWIVRLPGRVPPGRRNSQLVRLADLAPTVLGLLGIDAPEGFGSTPAEDPLYGRDLSALVKGDGSAAPVMAAPGWLERPERPMASLRTGKVKVIIDLEKERMSELYDLHNDSAEKVNRIVEMREVAAALFAEWKRRRAMMDSGSPPQQQAIDPQQEEVLRSLGYIR